MGDRRGGNNRDNGNNNINSPPRFLPRILPAPAQPRGAPAARPFYAQLPLLTPFQQQILQSNPNANVHHQPSLGMIPMPMNMQNMDAQTAVNVIRSYNPGFTGFQSPAVFQNPYDFYGMNFASCLPFAGAFPGASVQGAAGIPNVNALSCGLPIVSGLARGFPSAGGLASGFPSASGLPNASGLSSGLPSASGLPNASGLPSGLTSANGLPSGLLGASGLVSGFPSAGGLPSGLPNASGLQITTHIPSASGHPVASSVQHSGGPPTSSDVSGSRQGSEGSPPVFGRRLKTERSLETEPQEHGSQENSPTALGPRREPEGSLETGPSERSRQRNDSLSSGQKNETERSLETGPQKRGRQKNSSPACGLRLEPEKSFETASSERRGQENSPQRSGRRLEPYKLFESGPSDLASEEDSSATDLRPSSGGSSGSSGCPNSSVLLPNTDDLHPSSGGSRSGNCSNPIDLRLSSVGHPNTNDFRPSSCGSYSSDRSNPGDLRDRSRPSGHPSPSDLRPNTSESGSNLSPSKPRPSSGGHPSSTGLHPSSSGSGSRGQQSSSERHSSPTVFHASSSGRPDSSDFPPGSSSSSSSGGPPNSTDLRPSSDDRLRSSGCSAFSDLCPSSSDTGAWTKVTETSSDHLPNRSSQSSSRSSSESSGISASGGQSAVAGLPPSSSCLPVSSDPATHGGLTSGAAGDCGLRPEKDDPSKIEFARALVALSEKIHAETATCGGQADARLTSDDRLESQSGPGTSSVQNTCPSDQMLFLQGSSRQTLEIHPSGQDDSAKLGVSATRHPSLSHLTQQLQPSSEHLQHHHPSAGQMQHQPSTGHQPASERLQHPVSTGQLQPQISVGLLQRQVSTRQLQHHVFAGQLQHRTAGQPQHQTSTGQLHHQPCTMQLHQTFAGHLQHQASAGQQHQTFTGQPQHQAVITQLQQHQPSSGHLQEYQISSRQPKEQRPSIWQLQQYQTSTGQLQKHQAGSGQMQQHQPLIGQPQVQQQSDGQRQYQPSTRKLQQYKPASEQIHQSPAGHLQLPYPSTQQLQHLPGTGELPQQDTPHTPERPTQKDIWPTRYSPISPPLPESQKGPRLPRPAQHQIFGLINLPHPVPYRFPHPGMTGIPQHSGHTLQSVPSESAQGNAGIHESSVKNLGVSTSTVTPFCESTTAASADVNFVATLARCDTSGGRLTLAPTPTATSSRRDDIAVKMGVQSRTDTSVSKSIAPPDTSISGPTNTENQEHLFSQESESALSEPLHSVSQEQPASKNSECPPVGPSPSVSQENTTSRDPKVYRVFGESKYPSDPTFLRLVNVLKSASTQESVAHILPGQECSRGSVDEGPLPEKKDKSPMSKDAGSPSQNSNVETAQIDNCLAQSMSAAPQVNESTLVSSQPACLLASSISGPQSLVSTQAHDHPHILHDASCTVSDPRSLSRNASESRQPSSLPAGHQGSQKHTPPRGAYQPAPISSSYPTACTRSPKKSPAQARAESRAAMIADMARESQLMDNFVANVLSGVASCSMVQKEKSDYRKNLTGAPSLESVSPYKQSFRDATTSEQADFSKRKTSCESPLGSPTSRLYFGNVGQPQVAPATPTKPFLNPLPQVAFTSPPNENINTCSPRTPTTQVNRGRFRAETVNESSVPALDLSVKGSPENSLKSYLEKPSTSVPRADQTSCLQKAQEKSPVLFHLLSAGLPSNVSGTSQGAQCSTTQAVTNMSTDVSLGILERPPQHLVSNPSSNVQCTVSQNVSGSTSQHAGQLQADSNSPSHEKADTGVQRSRNDTHLLAAQTLVDMSCLPQSATGVVPLIPGGQSQTVSGGPPHDSGLQDLQTQTQESWVHNPPGTVSDSTISASSSEPPANRAPEDAHKGPTEQPLTVPSGTQSSVKNWLQVYASAEFSHIVAPRRRGPTGTLSEPFPSKRKKQSPKSPSHANCSTPTGPKPGNLSPPPPSKRKPKQAPKRLSHPKNSKPSDSRQCDPSPSSKTKPQQFPERTGRICWDLSFLSSDRKPKQSSWRVSHPEDNKVSSCNSGNPSTSLSERKSEPSPKHPSHPHNSKPSAPKLGGPSSPSKRRPKQPAKCPLNRKDRKPQSTKSWGPSDSYLKRKPKQAPKGTSRRTDQGNPSYLDPEHPSTSPVTRKPKRTPKSPSQCENSKSSKPVFEYLLQAIQSSSSTAATVETQHSGFPPQVQSGDNKAEEPVTQSRLELLASVATAVSDSTSSCPNASEQRLDTAKPMDQETSDDKQKLSLSPEGSPHPGAFQATNTFNSSASRRQVGGGCTGGTSGTTSETPSPQSTCGDNQEQCRSATPQETFNTCKPTEPPTHLSGFTEPFNPAEPSTQLSGGLSGVKCISNSNSTQSLGEPFNVVEGSGSATCEAHSTEPIPPTATHETSMSETQKAESPPRPTPHEASVNVPQNDESLPPPSRPARENPDSPPDLSNSRYSPSSQSPALDPDREMPVLSPYLTWSMLSKMTSACECVIDLVNLVRKVRNVSASRKIKRRQPIFSSLRGFSVLSSAGPPVFAGGPQGLPGSSNDSQVSNDFEDKESESVMDSELSDHVRHSASASDPRGVIDKHLTELYLHLFRERKITRRQSKANEVLPRLRQEFYDSLMEFRRALAVVQRKTNHNISDKDGEPSSSRTDQGQCSVDCSTSEALPTPKDGECCGDGMAKTKNQMETEKASETDDERDLTVEVTTETTDKDAGDSDFEIIEVSENKPVSTVELSTQLGGGPFGSSTHLSGELTESELDRRVLDIAAESAQESKNSENQTENAQTSSDGTDAQFKDPKETAEMAVITHDTSTDSLVEDLYQIVIEEEDNVKESGSCDDEAILDKTALDALNNNCDQYAKDPDVKEKEVDSNANHQDQSDPQENSMASQDKSNQQRHVDPQNNPVDSQEHSDLQISSDPREDTSASQEKCAPERSSDLKDNISDSVNNLEPQGTSERRENAMDSQGESDPQGNSDAQEDVVNSQAIPDPERSSDLQENISDSQENASAVAKSDPQGNSDAQEGSQEGGDPERSSDLQESASDSQENASALADAFSCESEDSEHKTPSTQGPQGTGNLTLPTSMSIEDFRSKLQPVLDLFAHAADCHVMWHHHSLSRPGYMEQREELERLLMAVLEGFCQDLSFDD